MYATLLPGSLPTQLPLRVLFWENRQLLFGISIIAQQFPAALRIHKTVIDSITQNPNTSAPTMSESYEREQQNNSRLDELSSKVSALRGVTINIYDNARDQGLIDSSVSVIASRSISFDALLIQNLICVIFRMKSFPQCLRPYDRVPEGWVGWHNKGTRWQY